MGKTTQPHSHGACTPKQFQHTSPLLCVSVERLLSTHIHTQREVSQLMTIVDNSYAH